ncbi:hypothetical protein [Bacteroides oleiciplenus]|uniref:Major fimbrial subunit protein N-terminal domain-containing protein n=1 Tax=Bacteroides oleiciplenus YIT 12058 TaxID=742727 RepID=K9DWJ5_9BACE|nr:hypothetical protein [Bacteroides oleiciplenus]EKU87611.1 hypothetical protein HMPREF9447_05070 [Bacteroides oleiciplenus YIT 12058]
MRTKLLFGILLLVSIISFMSCDDDNSENTPLEPFQIEKQSYEVIKDGYTHIYIHNGSGKINFSIEDPQIIDASYQEGTSDNSCLGIVRIEGKQKGETRITLTDPTTQETEILKMKVIDRYLVYGIEESNHPALKSNIVMYLINNEKRDCYFFPYVDSEHKVSNKLIARGTYDFSVKTEHGTEVSAIPYLTLTYPADEKGNFTDATIPPTPHEFRFMMEEGATSYAVLGLIQHYLNVDWEALTPKDTSTRNDIIISPTLKMTVDDTNYSITGTFNSIPAIPEGTLD